MQPFLLSKQNLKRYLSDNKIVIRRLCINAGICRRSVYNFINNNKTLLSSTAVKMGGALDLEILVGFNGKTIHRWPAPKKVWKEILQRRKLSQLELAEKSGICYWLINAIVNGNAPHPMKISTLQKLGKALHVAWSLNGNAAQQAALKTGVVKTPRLYHKESHATNI